MKEVFKILHNAKAGLPLSEKEEIERDRIETTSVM